MRLLARVLTGLLAALLAGCAPRVLPPPPQDTLPPPPAVAHVAIPPAIDPVFLSGLATWHRTKKAPIIQHDGVTLYPYTDGLTVRCQVMKITDLEFSEGEEIRRVIVGSPEQWLGHVSESGDGASKRVHLAISPNEKGARTNVLVYTNKRTYSLEAVEGGSALVRVGFWFPAEVEAQVAARERAVIEAQAAEQPQQRVSYAIDGTASWRPVSVYNDGVRTYVLFPAAVRFQKMPVLYARTQERLEIVNYSVQWPYITIGQILDRGEMVLGVGNEQERVSFWIAN